MRSRTREMDGREGHESADTGGADRGVTRRRVLELGVGALSGAAVPASQGEQHALANAGREALSEALQRRLIRGDIAFEALLV